MAPEFGTGAVSLTGNAVTGTLSDPRGGTGLLPSLGSAYPPTVNSSGPGYTYANTGLRSMQVWTGNGTWSRPCGVRYIKVCVTALEVEDPGHGELQAPRLCRRSNPMLQACPASITIGGSGGSGYYPGRGGNGGSAPGSMYRWRRIWRK